MLQVSDELRGLILQLYSSYLSDDGYAVNYKGIRSDARFALFVAKTAELQKVRCGAGQNVGCSCSRARQHVCLGHGCWFGGCACAPVPERAACLCAGGAGEGAHMQCLWS